MKKGFILLLINMSFLFAFDIQRWDYSNNSYNTTSVQSARIEHLCSDFGKRYYNRGTIANPDWVYRWHKGIDFEVVYTESDLMLAPFNATVRKIYASEDIKFIAIENSAANNNTKLGFLHGFSDNPVGSQIFDSDCNSCYALFRKCIDSSEYCIIIINPSDTSDKKAYASQAGLSVTFNWNAQPCTLTTVNTIEVEAPFVPIGDSGPGGTHLHLSCYRENINPINSPVTNHINPLQVIDVKDSNDNDYANTEDYDINLEYIECYGDSSSTIKARANLLSPSGNTATLISENKRFSDAIMCIDRLDLLISPSYLDVQDSELIYGDTLKSYFSHRTREDEPGFYPSNIYDSNQGDTLRTGIDPYAYRSIGGQAYDDFYYADFFTRIHKNDDINIAQVDLANINQEARYPDGKYNIYGYFESVYDNVSDIGAERNYSEDIDEIEIIIDNFVPYIKEVKVKSNSSTVYRGGWNWWDDTGLVFVEQATSFCKPEVDILIEVIASEPMDTLYISTIEGFDWNSELNESMSEDRTEWIFKIPASQIPEYEKDGGHIITINGTDLSGNSLEILNSVNSPYAADTIPIRQSLETWQPTPNAGADTNYSFSIQSSASGITYNNIIDGIQTDESFVPDFERGKSYILTDISSLHPDFNLVAWGHSAYIDTCSLELDINFVQPSHRKAYKNMILEVAGQTFPIIDTRLNTIYFEGECFASSGDYRIYDPIGKEIFNIGIADNVSNVVVNSFVKFSDAYQYSGNYLSWFDDPARYTLTMSGETHDIKRHNETSYHYSSGELFFSDIPQWTAGEYVLKKRFPVVNNDIVSFNSMSENPDPGNWNNSTWCATKGWSNTSGSSERGDLDNRIAYNLADRKDYMYNGTNWEQILYPEIKVSPDNLPYFLVQSDIFTDQFTITNDGEGDLDYTVTIAANADTTYIDEGDGTRSDFDVIDIQCGIGSEGFYANMKQIYLLALMILFILG